MKVARRRRISSDTFGAPLTLENEHPNTHASANSGIWVSQQRRFQSLLALLPIGHHLTQRLEKARVVVAVFDMAEFVGHHVLDAGAGCAHQIDIQGHGASAGQAAPARLHGAHDEARVFDTLEVEQPGLQHLTENSPGAVKIPAVQQRLHALLVWFAGQANEQLAACERYAGHFAR